LKIQLLSMFEGNTISFKDTNVTLLSKKTVISYLASSTIYSIWKVLVLTLEMHHIHVKESHCLSCPLCLKVTPFLRNECDTAFKDAQCPIAIWKGPPMNERTCFTHKIAHPHRLHPFKSCTSPTLRMFIPQTFFNVMVCKGYIW
jgi:hypothetical protein